MFRNCLLSLLMSIAFMTACSNAGDRVAVDDVEDTSAGTDQQSGDAILEDGYSEPDAESDLVEDTLLIPPDLSDPPAGCCETDQQCSDGEVCVNTTGETYGLCLEPPEATSYCYQDSDCGEQGPCITKGPAFMNIAIDCEHSPADFGICKGMYAYCCYEDLDCPAGADGVAGVCMGLETDEYGGTCMPALDPGQCYFNSDCPQDHTCLGAGWCPCGYDCDMGYSGPGYCVPNGSECCLNNWECANGMTCAQDGPDSPGICLPIPEQGSCWDDNECGQGQYCANAMVCPCGALCDANNMPGTCLSVNDNCCFADSMCSNGQICVGEGPGGYAGVCVDPAEPGKCWSDDDCPEGNACWNVEAYGCNAPAPLLPGTCLAVTPGCCLSDANCPLGETCAGNDSGLQGVCLPFPEEGSCWDNDECPQGGICVGSDFCGCGEVCLMIGIDSPGTCAIDQKSCNSDNDCIIATKWDICCPCPEAVPKGALIDDPCMAPGKSMPGNLPQQCWATCPAILCAECPDPVQAYCENGECKAVFQ